MKVTWAVQGQAAQVKQRMYQRKTKLMMMDQYGEYIEIRSLTQFWSMVKPINEAHRALIKSTNYYQELVRKVSNYGYYR